MPTLSEETYYSTFLHSRTAHLFPNPPPDRMGCSSLAEELMEGLTTVISYPPVLLTCSPTLPDRMGCSSLAE
ncbi:hypothetical protein CEXT_163631 [Caerostris extrusa]|uniref:Uncharacterized protein n=1 Tax=Caerostris extrusa TaxID=172846 RepID=A0AAV4PRB0_CAEEX|nr:hypothetical protein CEXT_163631 [Caerostris extrusa]